MLCGDKLKDDIKFITIPEDKELGIGEMYCCYSCLEYTYIRVGVLLNAAEERKE